MAHPLHNPEIVRPLAVSSRATAVRYEAERELRRLLNGTKLEQDLLAMVAVADGGLSVIDLAELINSEAWQVEEGLATISARTFDRRPAWWDVNLTVYVLGHEELQQQARKRLGPARIQAYRQELHEWAEGYQQRSWPKNTPEYLLRDYYRLLQASEDAMRLVRLALDSVRHDRMLQRSGGDSAALEEIAVAQESVLRQDPPDLILMSRLAWHRDNLIQRNLKLPLKLPKLWARLGNVRRAEAIIDSMSDDNSGRTAALALLAPVVATLSEYDHAERLANSIPNPAFIDSALRARTLVQVVGAMADAGFLERAEDLAGQIDAPFWRAKAYGIVSLALAAAGDFAAAESRIVAISEPYWRAQWLALLGRMTSDSPIDERRRKLALQAAHIASTVEDDHDRVLAFGALINIGLKDEDRVHLEALTRAMEEALGCLSDTYSRVRALTALVDMIDDAKQVTQVELSLRQVESAIHKIEDLFYRNRALAMLASAAASLKDYDWAENLADLIDDAYERSGALVDIVSRSSAAGDYNRATRVVRVIDDPDRQARAYGIIVDSLVRDGRQKQAEEFVLMLADPIHRAAVLTDFALALAATDEKEKAAELARRAEALARLGSASHARIEALVTLISALVDAGQTQRAASVGEHLADLSRPLIGDLGSEYVVLKAIKALLLTESYRLTLDLTRRLDDPQKRSDIYSEAIAVLAKRGDADTLTLVVREARTSTSAIAREYMREMAEKRLIVQLGQIGKFDLAMEVLDGIGDDLRRRGALEELVELAIGSNNYDLADILANSTTDEHHRNKLLTLLMVKLVRGGHPGRSEAIARSFEGYQRKIALAQLATELASIGRLSQADDLVQEIDDPNMRAEALIALAREAEPARSRLLLARALKEGEWYLPLSELAKVSPDAVCAVADSIVHDGGGRQSAQGQKN